LPFAVNDISGMLRCCISPQTESVEFDKEAARTERERIDDLNDLNAQKLVIDLSQDSSKLTLHRFLSKRSKNVWEVKPEDASQSFFTIGKEETRSDANTIYQRWELKGAKVGKAFLLMTELTRRRHQVQQIRTQISVINGITGLPSDALARLS